MSESQRTGPVLSKEAFVACAFTPVVLSALFSFLSAPWLGTFLLVGICAGLSIFLIKDHFGPRLVGLRWYFERAEGSTAPRLVFFARPLPYVAAPADVSFFWGTMIGVGGAWAAVAVLALMFMEAKWVFMDLVLAGAHAANFVAFMKCRDESREQADNVARTLLLDTNISFQQAKEEESAAEPEPEAPAKTEHEEEEEVV